MREIKFRAWNTATKKWYSVGQKNLWQSTLIPAADEILMQYTGLKDKNGVEIYEGDVVALWHSAFPKDKHNYKVHFEDGAFRFYRTEKDYGYAVGHKAPSEVEIVGNIYEHGDLLTRKD